MLIRQFSLSVAADPNVLQLTFPNEQIPQPNLQSKSQQNTKKTAFFLQEPYTPGAMPNWSWFLACIAGVFVCRARRWKAKPRREWGGNNEKLCRSFANAFTGSPHVYPLAKQTASHAGYVIPSSNATAFHAYHSRGDAGLRMRKALAIKQGRLLITFFRSLHCGLETTCYSITWDTRV